MYKIQLILNNLNIMFKNKFFIFLLVNLFWVASVFAIDVDHFEVDMSPSSQKVWEAFDLSIKAVDVNNNLVSDFKWQVFIFSNSADEDVKLAPSIENWYKFTEANQWKVKFENAVIFKVSWEQDISVYLDNDWDVDINTSWTTKVSVIPSDTQMENIEIINPGDWETIWEDSINISWSTKKNYKVKIILNSSENYEIFANNNGIFEKQISWLKEWENTIKAQILDADWKVIWETLERKINYNSGKMNFKGLKLDPEDPFVSSTYGIEVIADEWLKEVSIIVNDAVIKLEDKWDGKYMSNSVAPDKADIYNVSIKMVDDMWHEKNVAWAWTLKVKPLKVSEDPVKEICDNKKDDDWDGKTDCDDTDCSVELSCTKVVVEEPEVEFNLNITWLKLIELKTKSILTWDALEKATSYNIYKMDTKTWKYELIDNVDKARYEVEVTWKKDKYEQFAVKALWKDPKWKDFEWDLSDAIQIRTGPEMIIILIASLLLGLLFLWFSLRRKN